MAQVLKTEIREAIIKAAKEEFADKGFKEASMRSIADKVGVTVGNLYRYFESKEKLFGAITDQSLEDLQKILSRYNSSRLPMQTRVFNVKAELNDLCQLLEDFADELYALFLKDQKTFMIMFNDEKIARQIISWFASMIESLIFQFYLFPEDRKTGEMLLQAHAHSLFAGMKALFQQEETKNMPDVLKIYLKSYIIMLDNKIGKQVV